jgi:flagellar biosynthesis GTPase FlhF
MSTVAAIMASPVSLSLKRSYDEAGLENTVQVHQDATTVGGQSPVERTSDSLGTLALPPSAAEHDRPGFLLLKDTSTMAGSLCTLPTLNNAPVSTTNKRTKLSAAEKDVKRLEKEARDRQRTEEKEKKEEKRIRDAEKEDRRRVKEEQSRLKEEERKLKEDEKKRKDEEKRLKEEEKEKKAKASTP